LQLIARFQTGHTSGIVNLARGTMPEFKLGGQLIARPDLARLNPRAQFFGDLAVPEISHGRLLAA
jgi:hypothetical protein